MDSLPLFDDWLPESIHESASAVSVSVVQEIGADWLSTVQK
jgi:hypothetical protein